jgi:LysR family transcriptional regulator of gallate degradation
MKLAMLLKKLRAVQAVSETGNTVNAASRLHLSQSAVVRSVQDVEAAIGCDIFERSARGMHPTPSGRQITKRIGRALDLLTQADRYKFNAREESTSPMAWHESRLASSISFRHLQTFLTLKNTAPLKQAAAELGVSLSAVHQTLNQLEHLAGQAFYHRGQNGIRLTEPGERAERFFKLALAELAQADEEISALQGDLRARIVIGTLPFSTGLFLPRALESVLSHYPGLQVTVIDGTYESLLHKLRHAEIDLLVGALRKQSPFPDVMQHALFEDPLCVVGRIDHPLGQRKLEGLRDLIHAPWIMPMPGTPAQMAFDEAFQAEGLSPPEAGLRVNSPVLIQALLSASDRVALMPSRQAQQEVLTGHLSILPITICHAPRLVGITTRQGYLPSPASQMLLELAHKIAKSIQPNDRNPFK